MSFKDDCGKIIFLSNDINYLFKNMNEVNIILNDYKDIIINDNLDIYQQINKKQEIINKDRIEYDKTFQQDKKDKDSDDKEVEKFKYITNKLKKRKIHKFSQKQTKERKKKKSYKDLELREFTRKKKYCSFIFVFIGN